MRIAVDGPSGAGKSTIAKAVAEKLGIDYVDTGAMYRAIGYKMKREGIEADDIGRLEKMLASTDIDFVKGDIILDGEVVSVIMDGRDIGNNVLKDAEHKFFLTASAEERAGRRYKELKARGEDVSFDQVLNDIQERDHRDSTRKLNPLRKAEDALEIDSTGLSIDEVTEMILKEIR